MKTSIRSMQLVLSLLGVLSISSCEKNSTDTSKGTAQFSISTIEKSSQVYISPFNRNVNFIDVDVTRLYVPSITTDNVEYPNFGMYFRLWPGEWMSGFRFTSSDWPEAYMRPQLTVYYTVPN